VRGVGLKIAGVDAEAQLKVRLENLTVISGTVERHFPTATAVRRREASEMLTPKAVVETTPIVVENIELRAGRRLAVADALAKLGAERPSS
jgi:hypothetical protein